MSTKQISCDESAREWKRLIRLAKKRKRDEDSGDCDDGVDPFECDSIACPSLHSAVDRLIDNFVQQWKLLDSRKFSSMKEEEDTEQAGSNDGTAPQGRRDGRQWRHIDRTVCLPEHFDYKTERSEPPEDDGKGDRVVSTEDPTETLSYHQELWKLFASVPKHEALRAEYSAGSKLTHTKAMYDEIIASYQAYMRVDAHFLGRLRLANQHSFPTTAQPVIVDEDVVPSSPIVSTIRFECFRRQPKRGPQPDQCRLVLEFLSTQTLLDFHRAIVQFAEDGLWESATVASRDNDTDGDKPTAKKSLDCSGLFLIEDTIYTTGDVDYYGPIKEWIDGNNPPNDTRRNYLGIDRESPLEKVDMATTKLGQLSVRLATRYCHICHGDVETAVFVTDRRLTRRERGPYPIIHDRWMPMINAPICECCQYLPGVYVTNTTCTKTDGLRHICADCCKQLSLSDDDVQSYFIWKFQPDLSVGATQELAL